MVKKGKPKFLPRAAPAGGFPLRPGVVYGEGGREREAAAMAKYWERPHFRQKPGPAGTEPNGKIFFLPPGAPPR